MYQFKRLGELMTLGSKKNQHCIDMDGFKVYYEQIGSKR